MGERNPVAETGVAGPFGAGLGLDALPAISDATAARRGSGQGEGWNGGLMVMRSQYPGSGAACILSCT